MQPATKIEVIYDSQPGSSLGWYVRFAGLDKDGESWEIDSPALETIRYDAGKRRLSRLVRLQAYWEGLELPRPLVFDISR